MRNIFIITLLFLFLTFKAYSESVNEINVVGNDRVSAETIILFSGFKDKDKVNPEILNSIIKNLYSTNFFSDVKVSTKDGKLLITVVENPVVEEIEFIGIKNKKILEVLNENIKLKTKTSFLLNELKSDEQLISNILRSNGFYFSEISTSIQNNDNNTVKITYDVDLGDRAYINKIKFIGDKKFKDRKLKNVIVSEEAKFWKFISKNKYLDINRIKFDENLLKNFYKNRGFFQVKVNSSFAKVINETDFELVFNIDAGNKFYFNNLELITPSDFSQDNFSEVLKVLSNLKGELYSFKKIEGVLDEIDKIALTKEFEFINASYVEEIKDDNKLNLKIKISETDKFYVERINITGNYITEEKVLRNSLIIDEGDAYNKILLNKSINNIKGKNIFSKVNVKTIDGTEDRKKIIEINVEEKPTGEISAGAGTGTSGSTVSFGIRENNYLGRGVKLKASLSFSDTGLRGLFSSTNPNYKNSDRSLTTSVERVTEDLMDKFGFKNEKTGFSFGTSYEQFQNVYFSPEISNYYESLTTNSSASAAKKKQDGDYLDSYFNYGLSLNKLNQNYQPTDGYRSAFYQSIPLYSEDYSIANKYTFSRYHSLTNDMILSYSIYAQAVNSLSSEDVRVTKRVYIPQRKLRGFVAGKVGPKDAADFIGGNYGSAFNVNTTLPKLFPTLQNVDFNLFFDAANVWGVDYNSALDKSKIRTSTGLAMDWFTPVGPLSFSLAQPITKASSDETETFRFNIGTTF